MVVQCYLERLTRIISIIFLEELLNMKLQQKIFLIIVVLALAVASLGWIANTQFASASNFASTSLGAAQVSMTSGANAQLADANLPTPFPGKGKKPNVSWNG
jgi:hypothetical protein